MKTITLSLACFAFIFAVFAAWNYGIARHYDAERGYQDIYDAGAQ